MEKEPSTPERELLKVIENKEGSILSSKRGLRKGFSLFSWGALRGRFSFLRGSFKDNFLNLSLDIKSINRLLFLFLGVIILLFSSNIFNSYKRMDKNIKSIFQIQPPKSFKFVESSILKKPSFYLEKVRKRDIFKMASQVKEEKKPTSPEVKKASIPSIAEKVKDLRLVGIAWSEDPDVMIEDTKLKKTFFLKRGDYINDLEVRAIFKDKVVLGYESEEIELK
ncbi:MAG TPA: hypothetical protein ENI31_06695 [Candidatus Omnitrophica bacterium]|nr:MAG: hypothetical protein DRP69_02450 [Candidatus Omnitrophota bacterium]RKY43821.1 MAG: hypothetical protein DRP80_04205 [Candidatus Omnitrophota bacterium]HEC69950.1 hypothetical protein [Candidatus Omnitrophota bacterium]